MLKKFLSNIFSIIRGSIGYLLLALNTVFISILFAPIAYIKKYSANKLVHTYCLLSLHKIGGLWININYLIIKLIAGVKWNVTGLENLNNLPKDKWYMLISNHQSWNDVLILQFLLNKSLPFQKYLVKEKMRKVPIMGFVWQSIDCPFLARKNVKNNTDDINIIKQKCKKFKLAPASISVFLEGTRFTKSKHETQNSPYKNLLIPKAGGMAAILEELHNEIKGVVDVSICYHPRKYSFWDLFSGKINQVSADIRFIEIPQWLKNNYKNNISYENYKQDFQLWVNDIWKYKDNWVTKCYTSSC